MIDSVMPGGATCSFEGSAHVIAGGGFEIHHGCFVEDDGTHYAVGFREPFVLLVEPLE